MFHEHWGERDARCAGRGGGRKGFRSWGRHFGRGGPGGGGGMPFGRFVGDGDLRLIVLSLLAEGPRHGYDLIKAMEERSSGYYSPSPGVIYPTLTYLEEAGHASSSSEGNKKVYAITDAGRTWLEENRAAADAVLARVRWIGERLAQARNWFEGGDERRGGDRDIPDAVPELNEARRALKSALAASRGASAGSQRRIADLLKRAANEVAEIAKGDDTDTIDL